MTMTTGKLKRLAAEFIASCPENRVEKPVLSPIFDHPLLACAAADDSLFEQFREKSIAGPAHRLPGEWLQGAGTVISYFLPFSEEIRKSNRKGGIPSIEWLYGRYEGEMVNNALRKFLAGYIRDLGFEAAVPSLDNGFKTEEFRSNWSERHVGFIAGLGTFSLNRSFITRRGSAGRLGSVITTLRIPPTPRAYSRHDEYCSRCGSCILRCPPLAIDKEGKDNTICSDYIDRVLGLFQPRYGCGKCQTGVPCEKKIPV